MPRPSVNKIARKPVTLHYDLHAKAFDSNAMPEKAKEAREEVLQSLKPDIFQRPKWDDTVQIPRGKKTSQQRLCSVQCSTPFVYNYRAEVLPADDDVYVERPRRAELTPSANTLKGKGTTLMGGDGVRNKRPNIGVRRTTEIPVHPDLKDAVEWRPEATLDVRAHKKREVSLLVAAQENSRKKASELEGTRPYVDPVSRQLLNTEKMRREKHEKMEYNARMSALYGPDHELLLRSQREARELTKMRKASQTHVSTKRAKKVTTHHNGTWGHVDSEGCHAWSCCLNFSEESVGCVKAVAFT